MTRGFSTIIFVIFLAAGCQSPPATDDTPEATPPEDSPVGEDETMKQGDGKVNENNGLDEDGRYGESGECPPPQQSDQMCAQVITWAQGPEGQCCEYPTPCNTPEGWETFHSREECEAAAE